MPFCPNCQYEYEPEVASCPDCGTALVEKLPEETSDDFQESKFVLLRDLPSRLYAQMLEEVLEAQGIPCIIKGEDIGLFMGVYGTNPVISTSIWVPEHKLGQAKRIADDILGEL
ncbi:MAG: DUF2007 domain-containing protein [candidate division Zixibacteria bacterium]|nr:DUF2007 domain-containing protein [candidate division Zixibacteria bacterium]